MSYVVWYGVVLPDIVESNSFKVSSSIYGRYFMYAYALVEVASCEVVHD
jgi:hypothetical protein